MSKFLKRNGIQSQKLLLVCDAIKECYRFYLPDLKKFDFAGGVMADLIISFKTKKSDDKICR